MSLQTTHNTTSTSLQRELDQLRHDQQQLKVQFRDLEMGNDDLERTERAVSSNLADIENKYSRALEEKILLEQELIDKASLEEECQRLRDELRGVSTRSHIPHLINRNSTLFVQMLAWKRPFSRTSSVPNKNPWLLFQTLMLLLPAKTTY